MNAKMHFARQQLELVEVDQIQQIRHLRLPQVAKVVSCGRRTWLRWVADGKAPQPVHLGERVVAWRLMDIQAWLEAKRLAGGAA